MKTQQIPNGIFTVIMGHKLLSIGKLCYKLTSNRIIKTSSLGPWSNAKSPGDTIAIGNINDYSLFLFISGGANGYYSYITVKGYVNTSTNHHIVGGSKTDGTQGTVKFHVENNNTLVIDESDCAYGIRQVYGLFC